MRALLSRHVSGAPVVNEDGELVGVLSQSDVLRRCAAMPQVRRGSRRSSATIRHELTRARRGAVPNRKTLPRPRRGFQFGMHLPSGCASLLAAAFVALAGCSCCSSPVCCARIAQRGRSSRAEDAAEDGTNADVDAEWLLDAPVQQAMTPDPIFVHPGALVSDAAALMARHSVNRLPVLDHGRLVGILARGDVLAAFAAAPANVDDSRGDANKEQRYDTPQAGECRDM